MKQKILTIIFGMILLIGIVVGGVVNADEYVGVISNPAGIDISDFIAGTTTTAEFSFDYEDNYEADKHYPLVFKVNISFSGEDCLLDDCSVWKNDFSINGFVRRYYLFGLYYKEIGLECSEESPLTINHQMGSNEVNVPNGTFYCYNTAEGTIKDLTKRNEVFLDISSNPALYPATYKLTAQMFYADDTRAPIINIINKDDFEGERKYYRESDSIEIQATINENMGVSNKWGTIFADGDITVPFSHKTDDTYYFTQMTPSDILEDDYELKIFAEDTEGNIGEDSTTLKIDRTGPVIEAIQPDGSIYSEIIPIEFSVTDEKAGVDNESVQVRLREIVNSQICPKTGGVIGEGNFSCITTPWINLTLSSTSGSLFEVDVDTTYYNLTSGEYWLDAVASDILGNKVEWIAGENE